MTDTIDVDAGWEHACAVRQDGTAWCWGESSHGALGDGNAQTTSAIPVQVVGLTDVVSISAGFEHTCAVLADHTGWCWGMNAYGLLGDGTENQSLFPVQINGFTNIQAVDIGCSHTCVLLLDNSIRCWGRNDWGNLGNGTDIDSIHPVQVQLGSATSVSAWNNHTCAVTASGEVWCWGHNNHGQLGDDTWLIDRLSPVQVVGIVGAQTVDSGLFHTCAALLNGSAWCWGRNDTQQLGNTDFGPILTPIEVQGLSDVTGIAAGFYHSCAISNDGQAWCWGSNDASALGNPAYTSSATPVPVVDP